MLWKAYGGRQHCANSHHRKDTHSSEKTPRVAFTPEEADTWLLGMDWIQTPDPDGGIV